VRPGGEHIGPYLHKILYSGNSIDIGPENIPQLAVEMAYAPDHSGSSKVDPLAAILVGPANSPYASAQKTKARKSSFESLPVGSISLHYHHSRHYFRRTKLPLGVIRMPPPPLHF
jgi:hypothetical protein